jgi:hypothetical protein
MWSFEGLEEKVSVLPSASEAIEEYAADGRIHERVPTQENVQQEAEEPEEDHRNRLNKCHCKYASPRTGSGIRQSGKMMIFGCLWRTKVWVSS